MLSFVRNVLLLVVVPALLLWAGVMVLASVVYGLVLIAVWYLGCCILVGSARDGALLGLSVTLVVGATEVLLRSRFVLSPLEEHYVDAVVTQDRPHAGLDATLGWRNLPNNRVHAVKTRSGKVVYDVVYTTDSHGFRQDGLLPVDGARVLILGDSFAFGEGLNDDQTLGYFFKRRGFDAVNIAEPGMGPNQVLRQLQVGVPREIPSAYSYALLDVIDDHLLRASGRRAWMRDSPRFNIGADGKLVLRGTFMPQHGFVDRLLVGSRIVALIDHALLRDVGEEERRFVAILREIDRVMRDEYNAPLLVAYHSGTALDRNLAGDRARMLELLRRSGVAFFDVNAEIPDFGRNVDRYFIPLDGHPSALLNETVVDLAIRRFRKP